MKAVEFIEMQKQDVETHKNKDGLMQMITAMEILVRFYPDAEIDHTKTAEDCLNKMIEAAKKRMHKGQPFGFFFGGAQIVAGNPAVDFICEYLGLPHIDIDSILPVGSPQASAPVNTEKKRRSLEDFF